jgi:hypothetical protein
MTSYYDYQTPGMERRVEEIVRRCLDRLRLPEQPALVGDPYCQVCSQPLDAYADTWGSVSGFRPHQPGDCIHALSRRVAELERRLDGL